MGEGDLQRLVGELEAGFGLLDPLFALALVARQAEHQKQKAQKELCRKLQQQEKGMETAAHHNALGTS